MLGVKNLQKSFGSNEVLKGIDFSVDKGEVVAIIGSSGSGKTTLLRCIAFLEKANKGQFIFDTIDKDITTLTKKEIRDVRMKMGFVFQSFNLFRNKTALDNVMEGLVVARKMPKAEARKISMEMLEKVGMSDRANYYPDQLSGGQQQRVAIARAVVFNPKMILADEPTGNLDSKNGAEVMRLLTELNQEGTSIVMVTHNEHDARIAHRVIRLFDGHIVSEK